MLSINKKIRNPVVVKAVAFGILGSLGLFVFYYLTLLVITKDPTHPLVQMKLYQPWMSLLIIGFGIQVGFYSLLKNGVQIRLNRKESNEATAVTGTGAAVSGVSMAACCAHHVVDLLPILGVSGAALFLTEYQKELLIVGVIANLFGIVFMTWMLLGKQKPGIILNYLLSRRINR
jgi:hypothetical protein